MMHNASFDMSSCSDEEEICIFDACAENDVEALRQLLEDSPTYEEVNEMDKSGRTGLSHACANGFLRVVELLAEIPESDVNIPDNDGNTPLIFASQAGHYDIVRVLLNSFRRIKIDQTNRAGCTALIKAAIQGRTSCSKMLLIAGASLKIRDYGRGLCAEEWARFCGRTECARSISRFQSSKCFFLKPRSIDKWASEPDIANANGQEDKRIKRNNSFSSKIRSPKAIKKSIQRFFQCENTLKCTMNPTLTNSPFAIVARCVSTPILPTLAAEPIKLLSNFPRPMSVDNIPRLEVTTPTGDLDEPEYSTGVSMRKHKHRRLQQTNSQYGKSLSRQSSV